jgi:hypothetical protein
MNGDFVLHPCKCVTCKATREVAGRRSQAHVSRKMIPSWYQKGYLLDSAHIITICILHLSEHLYEVALPKLYELLMYPNYLATA